MPERGLLQLTPHVAGHRRYSFSLGLAQSAANHPRSRSRPGACAVVPLQYAGAAHIIPPTKPLARNPGGLQRGFLLMSLRAETARGVIRVVPETHRLPVVGSRRLLVSMILVRGISQDMSSCGLLRMRVLMLSPIGSCR